MKSVGQMLNALEMLWGEGGLETRNEKQFIADCSYEYRKTKCTSTLSGEAVERIERMYRYYHKGN